MAKSSVAKSQKSSSARPPTGDPEFGANLKARRLKAKLSQTQLAELVGVKKASISQFEKGTGMPSVPVLRKLGERLKCGMDALFDGGSTGKYRQPTLPGMELDTRINVLPDALREVVLHALRKAERALPYIPDQFIKAPTSETMAAFLRYLDSITLHDPNPDDEAP